MSREGAARGAREEARTRGVPPAPDAPPRGGRERPVPPPPDEPPLYRATKRALDVALALFQGAASLPVWAVVALAVKLEDGGPVFYGQERVGRGGERFRSWKFRTMKPRGNPGGPLRQADLEEHRVTRVGRVLRATALDELPQLWNILVGQMSYVGPRALLPEERSAARGGEVVRLEELPGYRERHRVRPGLTGLAQVRLPRAASHMEKFRLDVKYVRNRTLWLDLKLVLASIWISLRGAWPDVGGEDDSAGDCDGRS